MNEEMNRTVGDWSDITSLELPGSKSYDFHGFLTFLIGAVGFLVLVLVQPVSALRGIPVVLAGSLLAVASGLMAWGFWRALRSDRPRLVVDDQGILDRTTLGGEVFVEWNQIDALEKGRIPSKLEIRIRDMDPVIEKAKGVRRWALSFSRVMGHSSAFIDTASLGVDRSTLASALEERLTEGLRAGIARDQLPR